MTTVRALIVFFATAAAFALWLLVVTRWGGP